MSDSIVNAASPSTIPNSDNIIVCAIKNSSKTTPIILHITLQGDDFDANARPLGGGVRGAIAPMPQPGYVILSYPAPLEVQIPAVVL